MREKQTHTQVYTHTHTHTHTRVLRVTFYNHGTSSFTWKESTADTGRHLGL